MDEKQFKKWYETLTDEQKERAKVCKTPEELTALLGELGVELPEELRRAAADSELSDEELEDVAGGQSLYDWLKSIFDVKIGEEVPKAKYPCPVCGGWNVTNYDPGPLYVMRVYCHDCRILKCRDGSNP